VTNQLQLINSIQQFTLLNKAQFSVEYKLNLYIYNAVSLVFKNSVMAPAVCCWPQPLMRGYDPRPVHMTSLVKRCWDRLFFKHFRFYPVNKHNSYQKDEQAKPVDLLSTALLKNGQ
jgi:hypothetical protein